jgi:diphthine-ammonia ligase
MSRRGGQRLFPARRGQCAPRPHTKTEVVDMATGAQDRRPAAVVSWGGGKDSALALQHAKRAGLEPRYLLTMMIEDGSRSRAHGVPLPVLKAQARALGSRLIARSCSWQTYEAAFVQALRELRRVGAEVAVFGDLDRPNLVFGEQAAAAAGLVPFHPLYGQQRTVLARRFLDDGWQATIVAVRDRILPITLLGCQLTEPLIGTIASLGADMLGEGGEYHTLVTDGPEFKNQVDLVAGGRVLREGVWFLDTWTRQPACGTQGRLS